MKWELGKSGGRELKMNKKWTYKSKLTKESILRKINETTSKYIFSNLCMSNEMLAKVGDNNTCFYLFYTGRRMQIRSLYWTCLYVKEEDGANTLYMEQRLRPEIKYTYYILPLFMWLLAIGIIFKSIMMVLFMELIQLILSTIVLTITKNIGRKKQFYKVIEFLKQNSIIEN